MKELLLRLIAHMRWANQLLSDALQRDPAPDTDARRLFAHVLGAEHLWYARIRGGAPRHAVWPTLTPEECAALMNENATAFEQLLTAEDDVSLGRVVHYRNTGG